MATVWMGRPGGVSTAVLTTPERARAHRLLMILGQAPTRIASPASHTPWTAQRRVRSRTVTLPWRAQAMVVRSAEAWRGRNGSQCRREEGTTAQMLDTAWQSA